jgi:homoaconitase/3-isopropylmalate dehydratase large subunit
MDKNTDTEIEGTKNLYIRSFYRNPKGTLEDLENLQQSLSKINTNTNNIILMGDFNLPSINWENGTIKPSPQYGTCINQKMLDIMSDNNMEQIVTEPTRENNILDLCFTNNPGIVHNLEVEPGISDHNMVEIAVNTKTKIHKKPPRKYICITRGTWKVYNQILPRVLKHSRNTVTKKMWKQHGPTLEIY